MHSGLMVYDMIAACCDQVGFAGETGEVETVRDPRGGRLRIDMD